MCRVNMGEVARYLRVELLAAELRIRHGGSQRGRLHKTRQRLAQGAGRVSWVLVVLLRQGA